MNPTEASAKMNETAESASRTETEDGLIFPQGWSQQDLKEIKTSSPLELGACHVYMSLPANKDECGAVRMAYDGKSIPSVSRRLHCLRWGVITEAVVDRLTEDIGDENKDERHQLLDQYMDEWQGTARRNGVSLEPMSSYKADKIEELPSTSESGHASDIQTAFIISNTRDPEIMTDWRQGALSICDELLPAPSVESDDSSQSGDFVPMNHDSQSMCIDCT